MENISVIKNANFIDNELNWFEKVLNTRRSIHFKNDTRSSDINQITSSVLDDSDYAKIINRHEMKFEERIAIVLALIPHVKPSLLDTLFMRHESLNRRYTEFGGIEGEFHAGFIPTSETLMFILADDDLSKRFQLMYLFDRNHVFHKMNILCLQRFEVDKIEAEMSKVLKISDEFLSLIIYGKTK
jgi:hypothetical protein